MYIHILQGQVLPFLTNGANGLSIPDALAVDGGHRHHAQVTAGHHHLEPDISGGSWPGGILWCHQRWQENPWDL